MKIALLQYPIEWANPQANVGLLDERLRAIAGQADIAVVPEMFNTGFCTDRPGLAEEWGTGPVFQSLQHMADAYNIGIIGSMMVTDNGQLYNRGFFFRPQDAPLYYDKHHLYKSGGEAGRISITCTIFSYVWRAGRLFGFSIGMPCCKHVRLKITATQWELIW